MTRAILPIVLALALVGGVSAQDKPNFAGTWKAAASYTVWTITVEGHKMTVTQTVAGNSDATVYLLDGTPSKKTVETPNGPMENVSTSTWEGDVLVTTTRMALGTVTERRWLEPDGTMRVQNTIEIPGKPSPPPGPGQVFTKVGDVSAQDKPNFAGAWEMDRARSDKFAGGAPALITVEGSKMTVTRTMAGNSSSLVHMLDGTPSENAPCAGCPEIILTSKWERDVLVTRIGDNRIEKHSIQKDGTLKIEITIRRPDGTSETGVLVFNKVK